MATESQPPAPPEMPVETRNLLIQSWISTRMERDKSILTLAAAGIGLIVSLVSLSSTNDLQQVLFALGILSFLVCIGIALAILDRNATYVAALLKGFNAPTDPHLERLDKMLVLSFGLGILFTVAAAVAPILMR